MSGRLVAVCVTYALVPDHGGDLEFTGIDKRPVDGPVLVGELGLPRDEHYDTRHHGGPDQAAYAYADEDRQRWAHDLGRELRPGCFGENLVTSGVEVTNARIGERWRIGGAEFRVTAPRIPCRTFQWFIDEPQWVRRFTEAGHPGAYLAVTQPGPVQAGDVIKVMRPEHDVTIGDLFAVLTGDRERLERVAACPDQTDKTREKLAALLVGH